MFIYTHIRKVYIGQADFIRRRLLFGLHDSIRNNTIYSIRDAPCQALCVMRRVVYALYKPCEDETRGAREQEHLMSYIIDIRKSFVGLQDHFRLVGGA